MIFEPPINDGFSVIEDQKCKYYKKEKDAKKETNHNLTSFCATKPAIAEITQAGNDVFFVI